MPIKSKAQARYLHAKQPKMSDGYSAKASDAMMDIPERIKPKGMRQPRPVTTVKKTMNSPLASYE